jgi:hypothetical protein
MSGDRVERLRAPVIPLFFLTLLTVPASATGQVSVVVRGSALFESYEFSQSLDSSVDRVSELSLPLALSAQLSRRTALTVATGYARVSVTDQDQQTSLVSGVLDTELRLAFQAVPDRVTVFATSSFPTGIESVEQSDLPILSVLASDVIGFSFANLGGGGAVGGGVAVSERVGRMALGLATSFTTNGTYQPVQGQAGEFRPGQETRVRLGFEGPIAQRSFLQVSSIFTHRGEDEISGASQPSVGNTFSGSVALNQGLGATTLTLYVFDLFRSGSGLVQTPVGSVLLNRGNLFAGGAQWSIPLASGTSVTPRVEIRDSRDETGGEGSGLERVGRTTRFGLDLRRRIGQRYAVVLRGGGLTGSVVDNMGTDVDVTGYRVSLQLEILQ